MRKINDPIIIKKAHMPRSQKAESKVHAGKTTKDQFRLFFPTIRTTTLTLAGKKRKIRQKPHHKATNEFLPLPSDRFARLGQISLGELGARFEPAPILRSLDVRLPKYPRHHLCSS